jgi:hypothetical protein
MALLTFDQMEYNPDAEKLVQILCDKTQNNNPLFFRVMVAYYLAVVASMMRVHIKTHDRGDIPVNLYALNLSPSGTGKTMSTNLLEHDIIGQFRHRFLEETFPLLAEQNLPKLAVKRAGRKSTDPDEELVRVQKEFDSLGSLLFSFSEATSPAIKQMRHKLLMCDAGALNLHMDEVGNNLIANTDAFTTYLELFDIGQIKPKLTKNTSDSSRSEDIIGRTPANLMMFGTPSKLLNGGKIEEELYSMLETGYARRCFFGYVRQANQFDERTPEEVYDRLTQSGDNEWIEKFAEKLERLGDIINVNRGLIVSKETSLTLIEYRLKCEREAMQYTENEEIKKAEISHRYFKALKLAGAYAFIEDATELTEKHLYQAIKLAEECGQAFNALLTRDRPYVKLAKYVASCKADVTQADLTEDLPFYRGAVSQKQEMMVLATAWGYKNNVIIKKSFADGIEFFRGETLTPTDLSQMIVSYSEDMAAGYQNEYAPFDQLHKLTQLQGMHWVAHHFNNGHRTEENAIPGFNLIVVDIDGGVNMSTAQLLLKNYKYLMYTTKRHAEDEHRFRIIFPLNYVLRMDAKDYREFYKNVLEWLPFETDSQVGQRARKWLSHDGQYVYNDGELLDALPFIPKTSKNEERKELLSSQQSMDNLERWVINNIGDGNRNNMLLRYAMILVDAGFDFETIRQRVMGLNDKIVDKLDEIEIMNTIMITVGKAISKKA